MEETQWWQMKVVQHPIATVHLLSQSDVRTGILDKDISSAMSLENVSQVTSVKEERDAGSSFLYQQQHQPLQLQQLPLQQHLFQGLNHASEKIWPVVWNLTI